MQILWWSSRYNSSDDIVDQQLESDINFNNVNHTMYADFPARETPSS